MNSIFIHSFSVMLLFFFKYDDLAPTPDFIFDLIMKKTNQYRGTRNIMVNSHNTLVYNAILM